MDKTNYYFYMKTLEELRRKRDDLLEQKRCKEFTQRLQSLQTAYQTLLTNIDSISNLVRHIAEDKSYSAIKTDANYIKLNAEAVKDLREIIKGVKEVLSQKLDKAALNFAEDDFKEFVESAERKNAEFNRVLLDCSILIKNIQKIKNGVANEISQGETIDLLSINKGSGDRSMLVSSFMQTFTSINLSSSSPIQKQIRLYPCHEEN